MDWNRILGPVDGMDTFLGVNLTEYQRLFIRSRPSLKSRGSLESKVGRTIMLAAAARQIRADEPELASYFPEFGEDDLDNGLTTSPLLQSAIWFHMQAAGDAVSEKDIEQLVVSEELCTIQFVLSLQRSLPIERVFKLPAAAVARLREVHPISNPDLPIPISMLMHGLWKSRTDLQDLYPLHDFASQAGFVLWFVATAPRWYRLSHLGLPQNSLAYLNAPRPDAANIGTPRLSRFMELAAGVIKHPAFPASASSREMREDFVTWFFENSMESFDSPPSLLLPLWTVPSLGVSKKLLKSAFRTGFVRNALDGCRREFVCRLQDGALKAQTVRKNRRKCGSGSRKARPDLRNNLASAPVKPGVTVVGPMGGTYGIAHHARTTVASLKATSMPSAAFAVAPSFASCHKVTDYSGVKKFLTDNPEYAINLFASTPDFLLALTPDQVQRLALTQRYNILYAPWELEHYPAALADIANLFDEFWAPTMFVKEAVENVVHRPIFHMTLPVVVSQTRRFTKTDFGLPEERFHFLFSFDSLSFLERKNPLAVIRAFTRAFPKRDKSVGLVIKIKNGRSELITSNRATDLEIDRLTYADERITLVDEELDRDIFTGLMSVCDCYVSLHRSEGFGYGMAEAMALGKPVIATNYSGNLDFTRPETAFLVDYDIVPLKPGDYHLGDGQVWAEAKIEQAVDVMRTVRTNETLRDRVRLAGQKFVQENHSLEVCGERYRQRLTAILDSLGCRNSMNSDERATSLASLF